MLNYHFFADHRMVKHFTQVQPECPAFGLDGPTHNTAFDGR